jgi:hypothetical protein
LGSDRESSSVGMGPGRGYVFWWFKKFSTGIVVNSVSYV